MGSIKRWRLGGLNERESKSTGGGYARGVCCVGGGGGNCCGETAV